MAAIEAASASWFGRSDALPVLGSGGTYPHRDLTLAAEMSNLGLHGPLDQLSTSHLKAVFLQYV